MPKTTTTMITSIPQDLISDILSRLPVKSLLRFKCVSKLWCSLISSSNFINLHLHHSNKNQQILLYDHYLHSINCDVLSTSCNEAVEIASPFDTFELEIMGSCNGLLLISPYQDIVFLWNPSTNELKILPPTPIDFPPRDNYQLTEARAMVFGLGYDSVAKDYKVVRIVVFDGFGSDKDGSEVKVYSLGTDSWRRIGEVPESWKWIGESPYAARDQTISRSGKHVSGRLHWLLYDKNETESEWAEDGGCTEQLNVSKVIASFDIEGENYIEVPQPDYRDDSFHMNVDVLGGCLCILANYDTLVMDVWVMKEYGVKESWTRLFTIAQGQLPAVPSFSHLIPMKLSMEGEILLVVDYRFLVMYEPIHGMAKRLEICNLPNYFKAEIYVESLVAMNGVYMGQEQAGWKKKWTDIWNRKLKRMERGSRKALDKIWPDGYNAVEEIIIRKPELKALTS